MGYAGNHGHTFFLKDNTAFNQRSGVDLAVAQNPGTPTYIIGANGTLLVLERKNYATVTKTYHTHKHPLKDDARYCG